jgi:hypothetical protein
VQNMPTCLEKEGVPLNLILLPPLGPNISGLAISGPKIDDINPLFFNFWVKNRNFM